MLMIMQLSGGDNSNDGDGGDDDDANSRCLFACFRYEYIALTLEYKLGRRVSIELGALLVGFYSVVPHQLISVFLESEVQLLLSGLPQIDVHDWRFNTHYVNCKKSSNVSRWFWTILEEMSNVERSKLLQFVTGTGRVPVGGLAALQGHDGS